MSNELYLFSDYAFVDNALVSLFALTLLFLRARQCEQHSYISWSYYKALNVKTLAMTCLSMGILMDIVAFFSTAAVIYSEGFYASVPLSIAIIKPRYLFSPEDLSQFNVASSLALIASSFKTCSLFLSVANWLPATFQLSRDAPIMHTAEYRGLIAYGLIRLLLFPVTDIVFVTSLGDPNVFIKARMLLQMVELLVIFIMTIVVNGRCKRLMQDQNSRVRQLTANLQERRQSAHSDTSKSSSVLTEYKQSMESHPFYLFFIQMNTYLTLALAIQMVSLFVYWIEQWVEVSVMLQSKLLNDLLVKLIDASAMITTFLLIIQLFPPQSLLYFLTTAGGDATKDPKYGSVSWSPSQLILPPGHWNAKRRPSSVDDHYIQNQQTLQPTTMAHRPSLTPLLKSPVYNGSRRLSRESSMTRDYGFFHRDSATFSDGDCFTLGASTVYPDTLRASTLNSPLQSSYPTLTFNDEQRRPSMDRSTAFSAPDNSGSWHRTALSNAPTVHQQIHLPSMRMSGGLMSSLQDWDFMRTEEAARTGST